MKQKHNLAWSATLALLLILIVGCSRSVEDVAKWEEQGNTEKILGALEDEQVDIRKAAVQALGNLKEQSSIDALVHCFQDADESVRVAAVESLLTIGTEAVIEPLALALEISPVDAQVIAVTGLGTLQNPLAIDALGKALSNPTEQIACMAAESLGKIGSEKGSEPLVDILTQDAPVRVRLAAAEALALTGGDDAIYGLIDAFSDESEEVVLKSIDSLIYMGEPAMPAVLHALQDRRAAIRRSAITTLTTCNKIPNEGANHIWYTLANASLSKEKELNKRLIGQLARTGQIDTLLEAAAHPVKRFREYAFFALEVTGKKSAPLAIEAAESKAKGGQRWFEDRSSWSGAPSWRIDLWAALTALDPTFNLAKEKKAALEAKGIRAYRIISASDFEATRATIPYLIKLLGDAAKPEKAPSDVDEFGMPVLKKKVVSTFDGKKNRTLAKEKLLAAGELAALPLIAAMNDNNLQVAGTAAEILGELGDLRASETLSAIILQKVANGETVSDTPFYQAALDLNDPALEPILLKIRPNADRAGRIFEHKYKGMRATGVEQRIVPTSPEQAVTYYLRYIHRGRTKELRVTFAQDEEGNWTPTPALPEELPK